MTNREIIENGVLLGEGEWVKNSAYRVYEFDGKYYSVIISGNWIMDEYLEEITKEQISDYIYYDNPAETQSIKDRAFKALNLRQYNELNLPLEVGAIELTPPAERQYILRCLIKRTFEELALPDFLEWCRPAVEAAFKNQEDLGIRHPFCYITVRHGLVTSTTDDVWHVDGFSMNITHLPEQNYVWASHTATEYVAKKIDFPSDFNPSKHNIHLYIQDNITSEDKVEVAKPKTLYCFDAYVIHKRPQITEDVERTFVRISFTPIEISDINNTQNPLLPTNYTRDGITAFRDKLIKYK